MSPASLDEEDGACDVRVSALEREVEDSRRWWPNLKLLSALF